MTLLGYVHRAIVAFAAIALLLASAILTYSVAVRYFVKMPTDWQEEASVFLLVSATFLSAGWVQSQRGHVGIEAFTGLLSPRVDMARRRLVDLASLAFCTFFAWKSWTLMEEAWVDGYVSSSSWAPPLWIPYLAMAAGMSLLSVQILVQLFSRSRA